MGTATPGSNGAWTWSLPSGATANDGPLGPTTLTIDVVATNGLTSSTSFELTIDNVAPTGTFVHPTVVVTGSSYDLKITSPFDPSSADTTAGFTYAFTCDGGATVVTNTGTCTAPVTPGVYLVSGSITDKDSGSTTYGPFDLHVVAALGVVIEPSSDDFGGVVVGLESAPHTFTLA